MLDNSDNVLLTEFCWFAARFLGHATTVLMSLSQSPSACAIFTYNINLLTSANETIVKPANNL